MTCSHCHGHNGPDVCKPCQEAYDAQIDAEDAAEAEIKALGWHVDYRPPPIPIRSMDFQFYHDDYDGPECWMCGCAGSLVESLERIKELIEDNE